MNKNILKNIINSKYSLNLLINFVEILENNYVFLYNNWLKGKILIKPHVSRYHVSFLVLFDEGEEPDLEVFDILEKLNIKYKLKKFNKKIFVQDAEKENIEPLTGISRKETREKETNKQYDTYFILIEFVVPINLFNKNYIL